MFKRKKTPIDWNLNYEFIVWLNKWFRIYKKNASKVVDLEYFKFDYKGKKYTQIEIINRIIYLTGTVIEKEGYLDNHEEIIDEIFDLFRLIFGYMWW